MPVGTELQYESFDNLFLDPKNPRLGRHRVADDTPQNELLEIMREWVLDELAYSYIESGGFWTHESLIAIRDQLYGGEHLIVVEGNRRLAALKLLHQATEGHPLSPKWAEMVEGAAVPPDLFRRIPFVLADSRADVQAFLGFRHVTGIKQWDADEKAAFIAQLIDDSEMSYQQVARKIGSKAPTVRKHYIAYRLLLQIEDSVEGFDAERAHKRFTILYMSVGTVGAQQYLELNIGAEPADVARPVPNARLGRLAHFSRWLFGTEDSPHLVTDTRQVGDFSTILQSDEAVEYLESSDNPRFQVAFRIAGGDEQETIRYVVDACHNVELALMRAHAFRASVELQRAVARLGDDAVQLLNVFPAIKEQVLDEGTR